MPPAPLRRRWPAAEKRRIVELTMREGSSIQTVATQYDIHPTTLSVWRTRYRHGELSLDTISQKPEAPHAALMPVTLSDPKCVSSSTLQRTMVRIDLPSGASMRIETDALDVTSLAALFASVQT